LGWAAAPPRAATAIAARGDGRFPGASFDEGMKATGMSQRNVEWVIGRLVTDEAFRRRFAADPGAVVAELVEGGLALTGCERHAIASLDARAVRRFADQLDPRILKSDLRCSEGT
jgi:hypothetical protein